MDHTIAALAQDRNKECQALFKSQILGTKNVRVYRWFWRMPWAWQIWSVASRSHSTHIAACTATFGGIVQTFCNLQFVSFDYHSPWCRGTFRLSTGHQAIHCYCCVSVAYWQWGLFRSAWIAENEAEAGRSWQVGPERPSGPSLRKE